ncbi:MAG: TIGR00341 family protein, partial [Chitinophagaceae bacterium]
MYIRSIISKFFNDLFNLQEDKAEESEIVESIRKNITFRGTNLWTLIFAMFIASIGLNVNSPAVIIGAMLISPLMGPIMGIGLGIGIYDFELIKKGIKNLIIAAVMSIVISSIYFVVTPLHEASSELLARTRPALWDVIIAFLGGLAGIVAGTRRTKGNVIPGVAIATALMPPLCTAGYGLATGQYYYFLGALYLFSINSIFICLATVLIVRYLRFHKIEYPNETRRKRVQRSIWIMVTLTILPSLYLTWRIVQQSIFEEKAKRFIQTEFQMNETQVVNQAYRLKGDVKVIELLLLGRELRQQTIDSISQKLGAYDLKGTKLVIRQGLDAEQKIDIAQIKASIAEDVFKNQALFADTFAKTIIKNKLPDLSGEVKSLQPSMKSYALAQAVVNSLDSSRKDTVMFFYGEFDGRMA